MLSNFGVGSDSIGSGAFKDRLSSQTKSLSLYEKRELEGFIGDLYSHIINEIKVSRKLSEEAMSSAFTGQFITGYQAKSWGLVDGFAYWYTLPELLESGKDIEETVAALSLESYREPMKQQAIFSIFNQIAVIEIDGPIVEGRNKSNLFYGGKVTGADDIEQVIETIKEMNKQKLHDNEQLNETLLSFVEDVAL